MIQKLQFFIIGIVGLLIFSSCGKAGVNDPGTEYVPDMVHSIAYEANYSNAYYKNTWGSDQEYYDLSQPRVPVKGTIPRGYVGHGNTANGVQVPLNSYVPYYYANTEAERLRASAEMLSNPFPITKAGLGIGKDLYEVNCGICHGNKADGDGFLVSEKNTNSKYPAQPANLLMDKFMDESNGFYYFAIMHGKNVMGSYSDKLSYKERWEVIHYIRSLQAKQRGLVYNENENTFSTHATPASGFNAHSTGGNSTEMMGTDGHTILSGTTLHGATTTLGAGGVNIHAVDGETTEHKKKGWIKRTIEKGKDKISDIKENRAEKKADKAAKKRSH